MAAGCIRAHLKVRQRRQHGQAGRSDGGLGHIGSAKGIRLFLPLVVGKGRARIEDLPQRPIRIKMETGCLDGFHGTGKTAYQIPAHVGILASLTGKHEGGFSGNAWCRVVINPLNGQYGRFTFADNRHGLLQSVLQAVALKGGVYHQDQPVRVVGGKCTPEPSRRLRQRGGVGGIAKIFFKSEKPLGDCRCIDSRESQNLHRAIPGDLFFVRSILFEHHMKIAATESKGTDTAATWGVFGGKPGPWGGIEVKGTGFDSQLRVGFACLECGRENFVVERKR